MSISRLQLAAALIEYDNDEELASSSHQYRDHRRSAIFLPIHQARAEARRQQILSQPAPSLPSPLGSETQPEHQAWRRSTVGELGPLSAGLSSGSGERRDSPMDDGEGDLGDVDVARWGLPAHLVAEGSDARRPGTARRSSAALSVPTPTSSHHPRVKSVRLSDGLDDITLHRRVMAETQAKLLGDHRRAVSFDRYGAEEVLAHEEELADRPATVMGMQGGDRPERSRKISDPMFVPLPQSPLSAGARRPQSSLSRGWISPAPGMMDDAEDLDEIEPDTPNPFALPAPPPELGSRFDPKVLQSQKRSSLDSAPLAGSRGSTYHRDSRVSGYFDDAPHETLETDKASRALEDKLRAPTQVYDDIPTPEQFGRPLMPKRYTASVRPPVDRASLLRPKTLIMPSSLANQRPEEIRSHKLPEGYSLGEKPLPAEARTMGDRPLSLSQKTFRSSLVVGGAREDEFWVGGTEEEGAIAVHGRDLDQAAIQRKPGKLYGKSLMDQLEARKAALKSRQRVFTGDSRPAMMARSSMYDMPTVSISPTSPEQAQGRPASIIVPPHQPRGPLLAFDSNGEIHPTSAAHLTAPMQGHQQERMTKSKSVFGVDQLWEKEMAKLKVIQEQERHAAEARRRVEEAKRIAEEERRARKKKDKVKGKARESVVQPSQEEDHRPMEEVLGISPIKRVGDLPPALVFEPKGLPKAQRPELEPEQPEPEADDLGTKDWFRSDEEDMEGERGQEAQNEDQAEEPEATEELRSESDSDEDVPLSRLAVPSRLIRTASRAETPSIVAAASDSEADSDEDVPLSRLTISKSPVPSVASRTEPLGSLGLTVPVGDTLTPLDGQNLGDEEADEDDLPLAVRQAQAKGLKPITQADIIEDDLPLGYKHAEKAQQQMAERNRSSQADWQGRQSGFIQAQSPYQDMVTGMGWGMQSPQPFMLLPHQPVAMSGYPYSPGGYPGQVMGGHAYPGQIHMQMPMGMGMPMGMAHGPHMHMGVPMHMHAHMGLPGMPGTPQQPGMAIDSWRQDVALAPVPTGTPSSVSGPGGGDRRSMASSVR
ncbi:hypothetical protein IAU60_002515 [Kwoniella sp. DSM 27419]